MKKFLIILSIIVASALLLFLSLVLYIGNKAQQDTKVKSDVILVLGGKAYSGTDCVGPICKQKGFVPHRHYNPCVVARVDQAVSLYKNHYAPKILMSGGIDKEDNANEAETMEKIAVQAGVPQANILTENKSTSTYENFLFSQKILSGAGLHSVIIVTDPYHTARAGLVASKLQYNYSSSPALKSPCSDPDQENRNFLNEAWAIIDYKLLNRI
ncbi:MAG: YdcF family protein [Candidatus Levyibacteriota bacterium]